MRLCCTVLYCTVLYCTVLYYYTVLQNKNMFCFHLQEHSPQPAIVKICTPGDETDVGTSTDIDTDNIPEATGGTSTTKVEQVSVAKETTNGNVNRIIAMVTLDYPPFLHCFSNGI